MLKLIIFNDDIGDFALCKDYLFNNYSINREFIFIEKTKKEVNSENN